jgi:hypothetical protein
MARNELPLTDYRAEMVLMPAHAGATELVEALCLIVFGPNLPQRAIEPELLVGGYVAEHISIAPDQQSLRGYYLQMPPDGAPIRVRYGDSQEGEVRARFSRQAVRPLPQNCEDSR